jgi:hypothetical protein
LKVKSLFADEYRVVAVMDGDDCPAEDFMLEGEETTRAARAGLLEILNYVAANGLHKCPSGWYHEANKKDGIYEFIKHPLRLFFFKGEGKDIAVCTTGIRKQGQKADKSSVKKAATWRKAYFEAINSANLEVIEDEDQ